MDLLIFDFDGVIADTEVISNAVLADAIMALGHPTSLDDSLNLYMGKRWADCAQAIEAVIGRRLPATFAVEREAAIRARLVQELQAVPGAADFIRGLGDRPRCIASSSTPDWLAACLRQLGLAEQFGSNVYSAAQHVSRGKPHPDLFLYASGQMGAVPGRTVVIEDSAAGVEAGIAAGMTVIGLLAGRHVRVGYEERLARAGAHHLARSYSDVAAILHSLPQ